MRSSEGARFSQFVAFHVAGYPWLGSHTFQGLGDLPEMHHLVTHATPRQRVLLGFPAAWGPVLDERDFGWCRCSLPRDGHEPLRGDELNEKRGTGRGFEIAQWLRRPLAQGAVQAVLVVVGDDIRPCLLEVGPVGEVQGSGSGLVG